MLSADNAEHFDADVLSGPSPSQEGNATPAPSTCKTSRDKHIYMSQSQMNALLNL